MSNTVKKLSPFVLGLALCCYQGIQLPTAYAASFNSSSSADAALSADPAVQANTSGSTTAPSTASIDCPLQSNVSQSPLNQSANSSLQANASTSEALGVTPIPIKSDDSNSNYQSDKVANTESAQAKSDETTTTQGSTAQVNNSEPMLLAQAADDCCGIGGTTTCEVGGLPTGGAALGGLSPLLGLLGLLPAAAIPFALGNSNDTPSVPEPSTIPGIVAGFGLMGILLSRRYLNGKNRHDMFSK